MHIENNAVLPQVSILNENSVLITFANKINPQVAAQVASAAAYIQREHSGILSDSVAAYVSLMLVIDEESLSVYEFEARLIETLRQWKQNYSLESAQETNSTPVRIPVYYNEDVGPDLLRLAETKSLTIPDIIQLHQEQIYTVYTLGFAPGFAYMGNVNQKIAEARLATPRKVVAKGSVGIAGRQTGVYPQALPGGWNIIGRTPLNLIAIDSDGNLQSVYQAGDLVKFYPIEKEEFLNLGGEL